MTTAALARPGMPWERHRSRQERGDVLAGSASPGTAQPVSQILASGDVGRGKHAGPLLAQNARPARGEDSEQAFDLNIEKVLEHWTVSFAIRELIANALDEQALTGTAEPAIFKDAAGDWHVADAGRGLRYEHLTQNENAEKRAHP